MVVGSPTVDASAEIKNKGYEDGYQSWTCVWLAGTSSSLMSSAYKHSGSYSLNLYATDNAVDSMIIYETDWIEYSGRDLQLNAWRYVTALGSGDCSGAFTVYGIDSTGTQVVHCCYYFGNNDVDWYNSTQGSTYHIQYRLSITEAWSMNQWIQTTRFVNKDFDNYHGAGSWANRGVVSLKVQVKVWARSYTASAYYDDVQLIESVTTTQQVSLHSYVVPPVSPETNNFYKNNYNDKIDIDRPNAYTMRIHFHYLHLYNSNDHVYIKDNSGNTLQSWSSEVFNEWSNWFSVSSIDAYLVTDSSGTDYGFLIDYVEWKTFTQLSTTHNVKEGITQTMYIKDASYLTTAKTRLHFTKIDLSSGDRMCYRYSWGGNFQQWSGPTVLTDTWSNWLVDWYDQTLYLDTTDLTNPSWGFSIDKIELSLNDGDGNTYTNYYMGRQVSYYHSGSVNDYFTPEVTEHMEDMGVYWEDYANDDLSDTQVAQVGDYSDIMFLYGHGVGGSNPGNCYNHDDGTTYNDADRFTPHDVDEYNTGYRYCEWIVFYSCDVMSSSECDHFLLDSDGSDGLHGVIGWRVPAPINSAGQIGHMFMFYLQSTMSIWDAWRFALQYCGYYNSATVWCVEQYLYDCMKGYGPYYDDHLMGEVQQWDDLS